MGKTWTLLSYLTDQIRKISWPILQIKPKHFNRKQLHVYGRAIWYAMFRRLLTGQAFDFSGYLHGIRAYESLRSFIRIPGGMHKSQNYTMIGWSCMQRSNQVSFLDHLQSIPDGRMQPLAHYYITMQAARALETIWWKRFLLKLQTGNSLIPLKFQPSAWKT